MVGAARGGGSPVPLWSEPVESRVLGYGGGEVVASAAGLLVVSAEDQQWYSVADGSAAAVTRCGPAVRYGDGALSADQTSLYCVRERDRPGGEPEHDLVEIDLRAPRPAPPRHLVGGHDFLTAPRPSLDGRYLAWLAWDHPHMPWDTAALHVATLTTTGAIRHPRRIAGGGDCSAQQPRWHPDGSLVFLCDSSGWWAPQRWDPGSGVTTALCEVAAEFAEPPWQCGTSTMGVLSRGELLVATTRAARTSLGVLPPGHPVDVAPEPLSTPLTYLPGDQLAVLGDSVLLVAATLTRPAAVVRLDMTRGADGRITGCSWDELRSAREAPLDPAFLPTSRVVHVDVSSDLRTEAARGVDAVLHLPRHPDVAGPAGAAPPLLLDVHGGPTSRVPLAHSASTAYWTTRGFAVLYPNYGGSSGAGRAARERLRGSWGRVDVSDCLAAAAAVTSSGAADPAAVFVRGSSAGAYTALCAARSGAVRGVVCVSGVSDPARLGAVTHKFESRYVDALLGGGGAADPLAPWPGTPCPVLLLHGEDDEVVPVDQAVALCDALRGLGGRVALVVFPGEGHSLTTPASVAAAMALESAFYAELLGDAEPQAPPLPWAR